MGVLVLSANLLAEPLDSIPRPENSMNAPNPIHARLALILLIVGAIFLVGVRVGVRFHTGQEGPLIGMTLLWLAGAITWIWGCVHFAIARKLHPAYGLLGFFFLIGLLAIVWCASKQPEWERGAALRRAANPKKEYRGDPDSPY